MNGGDITARSIVVAALVLGTASIGAAQGTGRVRGFLDVGGGISVPAADGFESAASVTSDQISGEYFNDLNDDFRARYKFKNSGLFDIGGGLVFRSRFTVGVAVTYQRSERPADVTVTLHHPLFHPTLTASTTTDPLERRDTAVHLSAGYVVPMGNLNVLAFAGPSRFSVSHQLMAGLSFEETTTFRPRPPSITYALAGIEDVAVQTERGSAWGYNVGADVSYFFTPTLGVGGVVRYSDAMVALLNPLNSTLRTGYTVPFTRTETVDVDTRRVDVTVGVRLKF